MNNKGRYFKQFFWLLQTGVGGIALLLLLTACFGQPCPVGVPAPPRVALVADQGVVYVSGYYSSNIYAAASHGLATMLQASNGSRLGDTGTEKSFLGASDGILYLIDQQHVLSALRASDRSQVWQYQTGDVVGFVVDNGTIYLAANTDATATVVALRASDGAVLWQYQSQTAVQQFAAGSGFVSFFVQGALVTLHASDGTRAWAQGFEGYYAPFLKIGGDVLYLGAAKLSTTSEEVQALRVSDGTRLWLQSAAQGQQLLAVGVNAAYLSIPDTNNNQTLKALRGSDGTLLWQKSLKDANSLRLLADADTLYLVFARRLSAWRANDGSQLWQQPIHLLDGGYSYDLAASDGSVYLGVGGLFHHGSGCGVTDATYGVETVRASDGKLLWSFQK